jgi:predicted AAA+ superfamily ATPase
MVKRILEDTVATVNHIKKAIVITGPRQVGKTTFLKNLITDALWFDGDEPDDREFLRNVTSTALKARFGTY